jgi:NTP pyrophosphatase (non-canonical NTP hydrolase)
MPMSNEGLSKLIEECGEVLQVAGKIQGAGGIDVRHWDEVVVKQTLRERLEDEIGDLLAAINFVVDKNRLSLSKIQARRDCKLDQFQTWDAE